MLNGKVALVTGATSGIGLAMARALAQSGAKVMLNGLGDAAEIEKTRAELAQETGQEIGYHGANMMKEDEIVDAVEQTVKKFGSIDILVNNAGIQHVSKIEDFPTAKWDAIIAINLTSAFHSTKAALPHMRKSGWGRIINTASAHGLVGSPFKSAYVAAKHGIVGFTKVTALEAAGSGITCNAINPGWVRTELVERQIEAAATEKNCTVEKAAADILAEKQPSMDFVTPEQLGGVLVFLCSPSADQITGISLSVDGGWTAR